MTGQHASDCAVHNEPAYPAGPCDCHLSIGPRLDEMIKHAYQGSTEAADEIRQELVERYKAMQPAKMQPCAGRNCGSTDPNLHSAECFEDYEKATGMNRQEPVAVGEVVNERGEVDYISYVPPVGTALYTTPPAAPVQEPDYKNLFQQMCQQHDMAVDKLKKAQRQWVGLTTEEIYACDETSGLPQHEITNADLQAFAYAIEAKLKEKNT